METEEECRDQRRERIKEMKKEKRRAELLRKCIGLAAIALAGFGGSFLGVGGAAFINKAAAQEMQEGQSAAKDIEGRKPETADSLESAAAKHRAALNSEQNMAAGGAAAMEKKMLGKAGMPESDGGLDESGAAEDGAVPAGGIAVEAIYTSAPLFEVHSTVNTTGFQDTIASRYGIMIDVENGEILAEQDARERMNPASMTKILTLLVAAEHVSWEELDNTQTITIDITDYCYLNNCSIAGHALGEAVTVRDLFYGTILPSGADSAMSLAVYVAGSQEAVGEWMNETLEEMGLAETTHFTNCVGMYDEEHYSTAYDIAMILKAAADNEFCREVLSRHIYKTEATEQNPEGLWVANKFLRNIQELDAHGEVLCAKTGYVTESGCCAASLCLGNDGREYLCVTAGAPTSKVCMQDQAELYRTFISE